MKAQEFPTQESLAFPEFQSISKKWDGKRRLLYFWIYRCPQNENVGQYSCQVHEILKFLQLSEFQTTCVGLFAIEQHIEMQKAITNLRLVYCLIMLIIQVIVTEWQSFSYTRNKKM